MIVNTVFELPFLMGAAVMDNSYLLIRAELKTVIVHLGRFIILHYINRIQIIIFIQQIWSKL